MYAARTLLAFTSATFVSCQSRAPGLAFSRRMRSGSRSAAPEMVWGITARMATNRDAIVRRFVQSISLTPGLAWFDDVVERFAYCSHLAPRDEVCAVVA